MRSRTALTAMLLAATALIPAIAHAQDAGDGDRPRGRAEAREAFRAQRAEGGRADAPRAEARADRPRAEARAEARAERPREARQDAAGQRTPRADWSAQQRDAWANTRAQRIERRQDRPAGGEWQRDRRDDRQDFRQERREDRRELRQDRRDDRQALRDGQLTREQFQRERRDDRQDFRRDRRDDRQDFRQERREDWRDARRDDNRWRGDRDWNRGSDWNRSDWNDARRWSRDWRNDRRYDWQGYRRTNRSAYRVPRYYAPSGWGYGYRRFSIGISIPELLFGSSYWINDPWQYRLPPAYGPYRWVRYYDDVLLIDIRSGYVVDVIHDFFW